MRPRRYNTSDIRTQAAAALPQQSPEPIESLGPAGGLDPHAFVALCEPLRTKLWTLASGLIGDRHEAEDVVQEAVCVALQRLSEFRPGTSLGAWMGQIVRLLAQNWNAKRTRRRTTPQDPSEMFAPSKEAQAREVTADEAAQGNFDSVRDTFDEELARAIDALNPIPRACLLLRTTQGLNYDEIGELLGVPPGTAMSYVHRSRQTLRKQLAHFAAGSHTP